MPPLVSVLMPAYNAERYVAEAVESILAQTFTDFEFLIIDDGSTDRTRAILERFAARDDRIRLVSRPNTGHVVALNQMLANARGKLLARMDADDVALPDRFAAQVKFLRDHPEVVCVGGHYQVIDAKGRPLWINTPPERDEEIQRMALSGRCPINHPSVMMRARVARDVGGYREEMIVAQDLDLWLRMGERGQLANLPKVVLRYRLHDRSVSEMRQHQQIDMFRKISDEACDRRGIERRFVPMAPWRPTDRTSRRAQATHYGWIAFKRGDRWGALDYGLRAVGLGPLDSNGWRLLACSLLKPMRKAP